MQHNVTDSNKKNCNYNQNYDFQQKTSSPAP